MLPMKLKQLGLVSFVAVGALLQSCSCSDTNHRTQVIVTVELDSGVRVRATDLRLIVRGMNRFGVIDDALDQTLDSPLGQQTLLAIAPKNGDTSRTFEVEATALEDGVVRPVARVRAISGFIESKTLWLRLRMSDACIGVSCEEDQTCFPDGTCGDPHIDPTDLPTYTPSDDAAVNEDADALDARTDRDSGDSERDSGRQDASEPSDSGSIRDSGNPGSDGFVPPFDAGRDSGNPGSDGFVPPSDSGVIMPNDGRIDISDSMVVLPALDGSL